jgi:glyoxylase-like metal-dependent hydrolase (beta-lactamase superfamily II)
MSLLIPAFNASAWTGPTGNNTWLLEGRTPTLIDAGVGAEAHLDAVRDALKGAPLSQVLITHRHRDHASGADAIRARWPAVEVWSWDNGGLRHGQILPAGDTRIEVIHTPGHSPDHCCLREERSRDIYSGDLVRHGGTVVIPASQGGDLVAYLESLERIRALRPPRLLPGHGPIVGDPSGLIDEYVRHRAERDRGILDALRAGDTTIDEIVTRVYGELPSGLRVAAADTVLAHLIKLRHESRVRESGGRWSAM